jgi:hypothetical protein
LAPFLLNADYVDEKNGPREAASSEGQTKRGVARLALGLAAIRVRGIERVRLHADLIMLARLGQALSRARAVPLAA